MMILLEALFSFIAVLMAFAFPKQGARIYDWVSRMFGNFAQRRGLSVVAVGLFAIFARIAVLPVEPVPAPGIHDEFSYLMMGDTFAHGRVANPTHPMWIHFETFHVIQKPTYVSMYYPAQGLFLAVGERLLGNPFWGVVLSCGLMCAAVCWMLQEWVSPGWALLGGFLITLRLGSFSYWANSYYGGAVAALGGALVLGAVLRIKDRHRVRDALLMGLGVALLFNSRPYESLFFTIPIAIAMLIWICKRQTLSLGLVFRRLILPIGLVILCTLGAMGFYFWRTTGSPYYAPYQVDLDTYGTSSVFVWGSARAIPQYHHEVLKTFYAGFSLDQYQQVVHHPLTSVIVRQVQLTVFYFGLVLIVPVLAITLALPSNLKLRDVDPKVRFLVLVSACVFIGAQLPIYFVPHYVAMLTAVFYAIVLLSMRRASAWIPGGRPIGKTLVSATVFVCAALPLIHILPSPLRVPQPVAGFFTWDAELYQLRDRARISQSLRESGSNNLIIVRYSDDHNVHEEWVYNDADIDSSRVVWARDMGLQRNEELIRYYSGRQVWLVEPDVVPIKLEPYPGQNR